MRISHQQISRLCHRNSATGCSDLAQCERYARWAKNVRHYNSYHQIASKSVNYAIYSPHLNAKETDKTIIRSARDLINAVIDYWYTITLQLTPQKECKN